MSKKKRKTNYRKKCDDLWSKIVRQVGRCEICGSTGRLEAHHLLGKSGLRTKYRHDLSGGICLCSNHHKFDPVISAHGNNGSTENFLIWLSRQRTGQWDWLIRHKDDKTGQGDKPDYEAAYHALLAVYETKGLNTSQRP
jgi:hypothetical protein